MENFNVTTKEEKKELLERLGYTVFPKIEEYTCTQLAVEIERYISDSVEGYEFESLRRPRFQKITNEGVSGTMYSYELDKYGHLVYIVSSDDSGEFDIPVYWEGSKFIIDGFHYPTYAYVGYKGVLYYAGRCGTDTKIKILHPNNETVLLDDSTTLGTDIEDYLYDFLIFREKYMVNTSLKKTSMF